MPSTTTINRFGEPFHEVFFTDRLQAARFTKMIGAQPRLFSLIGTRRLAGAAGWVVRYRARKNTPWLPDSRATWPTEGVG